MDAMPKGEPINSALETLALRLAAVRSADYDQCWQGIRTEIDEMVRKRLPPGLQAWGAAVAGEAVLRRARDLVRRRLLAETGPRGRA